eukprot:1430051-Alexandrium_andersonii.AAC.1
MHKGTSQCRKTRNVDVAGEDSAFRFLKFWCLEGRSLTSRQAHVHDFRMPASEDLPSEQELEDR